ncbi:MAG: flagellin, partial [Proteobacteria bacterium]|nr:flagellin [Pseudomonadota bacterium]MCG8337399.1 flagellin [Pseudomonadota bacterium]
MGLRINHNVAAINSWRNLKATDDAMSSTLEKLSSGYKINRAADGPA